VMSVLFLSLAAVAASQPTALRVEYAQSPLAVDRAAPRFSWSSPSTQWAWRVLASLRPDLSTLLWDSGEHISSATSQHAYAGPPLAADTDIYWVVATAASATSPFLNSTPARFTTGLLAPADWAGAQWIGGFNQLRTNFSLPSAPPRARAYVTGVGCYQLFINGVAVANDTEGRATLANPGFSTIFSTRVLYNAYDVAGLLLPGENVVGLRLGNCKYGYLGEFCTQGPAACNSGLLRLSLGGRDVVTGSSWEGTASSILLDHFYNGEIHDGGRERAQAGWSAPGSGSAGAAWAPAAVRPAAPTSALSAHTMPQIIELGTPARAAALLPVASDSWTFDLGVNGAGRCTLRLAGPTPAGHAVSLLHAEVLQPSNNSADVTFACPSACCEDGGNCASQNFTYITAGVEAGSVEEFSPAFAYAGFRYVQVLNWPPGAPPPTLDSLACVQTSTGVESAGDISFNASTPTGALFNAIQSLIMRSQRSNLHSIPTDCAQREKRGERGGVCGSSSSRAAAFFCFFLTFRFLPQLTLPHTHDRVDGRRSRQC
jgi:alpha-L-rhamnosidase